MISSVIENLSNVIGWRTKKKYIIFESDDWGSIRMPSRQSYERLLNKGLPLNQGDSRRYNFFDTLASPDDFDALFTTLSSFKDSLGKHPVITAVSIVANPDFEKIRASGFSEYHYEPFTNTLRKYNIEKSIDYWKQGIVSGLFKPQFHGREHLNIFSWMRALKKGDAFTLAAFEEGMWGFRSTGAKRVNYQAAFDLELPEDVIKQREVLSSGLALFEKLHGYKASFFVPPNGPFNNSLIDTAFKAGIQFLSTSKIQDEPLGNGKYKKRFHYLGKRHGSGLIYLTRNAHFEPSKYGEASVDTCMREIQLAFRWNKPAIISTHRVNFIGVHDASNRMNGNRSLKSLLERILKTWPEVEFISSDELGKVIQG